jgi:quercetin dioxygenase-like cupin family protein
MRSVLQSAVRSFKRANHIKNVLQGEWVHLHDDHGVELVGIRGRIGACAMTVRGYEIGVDLIEMQPGAAFPMHVHPGDHILFVVSGRGIVHVDGTDHQVTAGETIYIPAEYTHGVKTIRDEPKSFTFIAFGYPHKHLEATDRMTVVA